MSSEILFFCKNLRKLREKEGLSKNKMAKKLKISLYQLTKIESGIIPKNLDVCIIFRISKLYKINPANLFCENFVK